MEFCFIKFFLYLIVVATGSSGMDFQAEDQSALVPLKSANMTSTFLDLIPNLSMDGNQDTCASSEWTSSRSVDYKLQEPARIYGISLLMHKYVDVNLEVSVRNSIEKPVVCSSIQKNTETDPEVKVSCKQETYGDTISLKDLRSGTEFFVICEMKVFGDPSALSATKEPSVSGDPPKESPVSGNDQLAKYIGIGCGAALLVVVVVIVVVFLYRRKTRSRRASEAHSLNTLSMMTGQKAVVQRQRMPIPSPRPHVVSRSIPNPYDRPNSVKDATVIYETIPGDEPPYLVIVGEKDLYDDASSAKK